MRQTETTSSNSFSWSATTSTRSPASRTPSSSKTGLRRRKFPSPRPSQQKRRKLHPLKKASRPNRRCRRPSSQPPSRRSSRLRLPQSRRPRRSAGRPLRMRSPLNSASSSRTQRPSLRSPTTNSSRSSARATTSRVGATCSSASSATVESGSPSLIPLYCHNFCRTFLHAFSGSKMMKTNLCLNSAKSLAHSKKSENLFRNALHSLNKSQKSTMHSKRSK